MHNPVAGLVVHVNDVRHGEDAGKGDLVREGCHCDPLPSSSDKRCGSRWEGIRVESSTCDVSEQH